MSSAPNSGTQRQEANNQASLISIWLGIPADGSVTQLFIYQQSAVDFQNANPDASVQASLGITLQNENEGNVTTVYAIGDSSYPVSGDQVPYSPFS